MDIVKYPRTRHVEGSRLQAGDHDLEAVPFAELRGRHLVVEEKLDGANAGVSFAPDGELRLQSRGRVLVGGFRERHFDLLETWAARHRDALWAALGEHLTLHGEWVFAKPTVFYDELPHYFLEFDVLDRRTGEFLDTPRRRELLAGTPVCSVPVIHEGPMESLDELRSLVAPLYKSADWRERLREQAAREKLDVEHAVLETDPSDDAEGLTWPWTTA